MAWWQIKERGKAGKYLVRRNFASAMLQAINYTTSPATVFISVAGGCLPSPASQQLFLATDDGDGPS
jgi:hypothetical protein